MCNRIGVIYDSRLAHVGTMEELRKAYPYNKEILLNLSSQNYQEVATKLKDQPISKMIKRGNTMVIYTKQAESVLKHLVNVLDDQDIQELEVQRPSLDELFSSIIKGK